MGTRKVLIALDKDLLDAARSLATRHGTSVASLVRTALEQQVALDRQAFAPGAPGNLQTLLNYSMGRIPRRVAMSNLAIDDYGVLLHMLAVAGLPQPVVPAATRKAMAKKMVRMLKDGLPR